MLTLGKKGRWRIKAFHIIFFVMWMGGVMSLVALQLLSTPTTLEGYQQAAQDQLIIDLVFIIPGGIGIVITAALYPLLTPVGKFKQFWIKWKWALTIVLVLVGAGFMGVLVKENAAYTDQALILGTFDPAIYWSNVYSVAVAGVVQIVLFLVVLHLSITKPLGKRQSAR